YLLAEGTAGFTEFHLRHIAKAVGTNNVNPISNMVAYAADPDIELILPDGAAAENPTAETGKPSSNAAEVQASLDGAITEFQRIFTPLLAQFDARIEDYLTKTFVADGTGADEMLDAVSVEVANNGGLFNTTVKNKADGSTIHTGGLQLNDLKTATPIDSTVAGNVKQVKGDMGDIAVRIAAFLTEVKAATQEWLLASQAATGNQAAQAAADQAFYDRILPFYVDETTYGWNDGERRDQDLSGWLEDWEENLETTGVSNLAVMHYDAETGRYLLTGIDHWRSGEKDFSEAMRTPIAMVKQNGEWKLTGNGYLIDCDIDLKAARYIWNDGVKEEFSGFDIDVDTYDPRVDYVVVTGPGLPESGLVLNKPGLLGDMFRFEGYHVLNNGQEIHHVYIPEDLSTVPAGAIYRWDVYDSSNNILQTVTSRNHGRLINLAAMSAAEKDALFPAITNITTQSLDWAIDNIFGQEKHFEFTPATAFTGEYYGWIWWGGHDGQSWVSDDLEARAEGAYFSISLPQAPSRLSGLVVEINYFNPEIGDVETDYLFGQSSTSN
ncbi:hypothetical protein, partial [Trichloromonas sp.]|uniref:hypothetical protein n=1 Tax=Trichloromonas sp. TaxID=3069249 RepID=UPI003D815038